MKGSAADFDSAAGRGMHGERRSGWDSEVIVRMAERGRDCSSHVCSHGYLADRQGQELRTGTICISLGKATYPVRSFADDESEIHQSSAVHQPLVTYSAIYHDLTAKLVTRSYNRCLVIF